MAEIRSLVSNMLPVMPDVHLGEATVFSISGSIQEAPHKTVEFHTVEFHLVEFHTAVEYVSNSQYVFFLIYF